MVAPALHDPQILAENMAKATDLWQRIMPLLPQYTMPQTPVGHTNPLSFVESIVHTMRHVQINPARLMEQNLMLATDHVKLLQHMTGKILGKTDAPFIAESPRDKRFKDDGWTQNSWFDYLKQSYLVNARWVKNASSVIDGLDTHERHKLDFLARQWVDATSPSNFALTNPAVLRATFETNGENLVKGLKRLLKDLEKSDGRFRITMTDENAFKFGENIACTKGSVIFQNDLIQLIQYAPKTKTVHEVPILLTPAWINKYYILDLAPGNSLVEWLVEQGFSVFVISWVNPDQKLAAKQFEHYLLEGPVAALEVIESITQSKKTHLIGYCLGGTLTAITLAYLRAKGQDKRIASATYLTTLIDFSEAGDLSVFIDEAQLESLENRMEESGYLDAADMANTFNMLRANDLIWSFVVNNYLLGKDPIPFDMLYWNGDATRMPAAMHAFYLRKMYKENALIRPSAIELGGVPINITKITTPSYILSTKDDHIAPWMATYAATQIYDGPVTFTLADSGHIAGVINGPKKNKYRYWVNKKLAAKPEDWLNKAQEREGSWWPHFLAFLAPLSGKQVTARTPGSHKKYPVREAAPGSYVKQRA